MPSSTFFLLAKHLPRTLASRRERIGSHLRKGTRLPSRRSSTLPALLAATAIAVGTNSKGQQPPVSPDPPGQALVAPPPPTTVTLRDGNQNKTVRWERFGNHRILIHTEKAQVFVNQTPLSKVPNSMRRCIDYALADCGVEIGIEEFVRSASQLPIQSRYGTKLRPIQLVLPAGFGVDVSDGSLCVISICEVVEKDRPKMFEADQQLMAYKQAVLRDEAKVVAARDSAFAAQDAANQLRSIHTAIQEFRRNVKR